MDDIHLFLAHAIELEGDAARRYEDLKVSMATVGNHDAEKFFAQMAEFSRMHLKDAMRRGGFREIPVVNEQDWQWPDGTSPEAAAGAGVDGLIDVATAMSLALDGEMRSLAFYEAIVMSTTDPEVRHMARAFAAEEAEHVTELNRRMQMRL